MSSAKKRVPLGGGGGSRYRVPVENREVFGKGTAADRALQAKLVAQLQKRPPPPVKPEVEMSEAGSSSLVTLMAGRLSGLESEVATLKQENSAKDALIAALKRKVVTLQAALPNKDTQSLISSLQEENAKHRRELAAMEAFLNDYGMIWVGVDDDDNDSSFGSLRDGELDVSDTDSPLGDGGGPPPTSTSTQIGTRPRSAAAVSVATAKSKRKSGSEKGVTPAEVAIDDDRENEAAFVVDGQLLLRRVAELNALAGDGVSDVISSDAGHVLQSRSPIQLTIYSNGFGAVDTGSGRAVKFRPYTNTAARAFMSDILDGYFPFELKEVYPDGVPFELDLQLGVEFTETESFPGVGHSLSGQPVPEKSNAIDRSEFLARLPERVVRNGQIVEVRGDVSGMLNGGAAVSDRPDVIIVETDLVKLIQTNSKGRPVTPHDVTTLQVKSPNDDGPVLLVKLRFGDTVGVLVDYVRQEREKLSLTTEFVLRTAFPARAYKDEDETLEACGLVPNAVMFVQ